MPVGCEKLVEVGLTTDVSSLGEAAAYICMSGGTRIPSIIRSQRMGACRPAQLHLRLDSIVLIIVREPAAWGHRRAQAQSTERVRGLRQAENTDRSTTRKSWLGHVSPSRLPGTE